PATGRIVGSCGSSSDTASCNEAGSTISNGITRRFSLSYLLGGSRAGRAQHVFGDLRAGADPNVGRRRGTLDDLLVKIRAAMMAENVGVAGDVDDAQVGAGARDLHHLVECVEHELRRVTVFHRWHVVDVIGQRNGDDAFVAVAFGVRQVGVEDVAIPAVAGI